MQYNDMMRHLGIRRDAATATAAVEVCTVRFPAVRYVLFPKTAMLQFCPQAGPNDTVQSNPITRRNDIRSGEKVKDGRSRFDEVRAGFSKQSVHFKEYQKVFSKQRVKKQTFEQIDV